MKMRSIFEDYRALIVSGILQGYTVREIHEKHFSEKEGYKYTTLQNYVCSHRLRECLYEWVLPIDDLPVRDAKCIYLSVNVRVIDEDGRICRGYYDDRNKIWHLETGQRITRIVAWQSLEVKE